MERGSCGGEKKSEGKEEWVLADVYCRRLSGLKDKLLYCFKLPCFKLPADIVGGGSCGLYGEQGIWWDLMWIGKSSYRIMQGDLYPFM